MLDLVFANPVIEARFRTLVRNTAEELGGWFLCTFEPDTWPTKFRWGQVSRALSPHVGFIEHFIIVPNASATPDEAWRAEDYQSAAALSQATARAYGTVPVHFHTHPNEVATPSLADIEFAANHCDVGSGLAWFCIVTTNPLRIWPYALRYDGPPGIHEDTTLECGRYWSWRMKDLRQWRQPA